MQHPFTTLIAQQLGITPKQIESTLNLLTQGATIPFISRYRKEATGALDEVQVANIQNENERLKEIAKRKETILNTIEEQGKLTNELAQRIAETWHTTELEDIYLPYKPKRHTRAQVARANGLEPLAKIIMLQRESDPNHRAQSFVTEQVATADEALKGARDIIAEWVNESEKARAMVRNTFEREAIITSKVIKGKESEGEKYKDYFEWSEPLKRCSSHRLLAMRRGEKEGFLKITISPATDQIAIDRLEGYYIKGANGSAAQVAIAIGDSYKRLLRPAIETEFSNRSKLTADEKAIAVFAENLRQLLLAPPLGQKRVLGIDPGYRTGCKVVCLDAQGALLHNETIYPHPPKSDYKGAARKITHLVEVYNIEAIAIGNGTASRETEQFAANLHYDRKVQLFVVSENGASIYSASKIARDEFPDYDVTVRGAISIGRRLIDPLAELVKIEPKSIGVGQYQHDVDQKLLKRSLDQTVENCVNMVGVEVNTASEHLLTYVSGLGAQLARNIVAYRTQNGAFTSRKSLLKVPRMGEKAYEQSAGFLRIAGAENPLDNTAVHPESYPIVEQMAKDIKCNVQQLIADKALREQLDLTQYTSSTVGMHTLGDILQELEKPGRDPRQGIQAFEFDPNIKTLDHLREGMVLPGIVTNITNFGCFVDVGIKENGLVHISQMANRFVSDPTEIVSIHQQVTVKVIGIDYERKRVQLTMKEL